jgi:hypothetical protein
MLYDNKMLILNGQQSGASIQASFVAQLCILAGREGDINEPGVRFFINQIVSPQTIANTFTLIEMQMPSAGRIYSYTPKT